MAAYREIIYFGHGKSDERQWDLCPSCWRRLVDFLS
jgi:hypothetical protein